MPAAWCPARCALTGSEDELAAWWPRPNGPPGTPRRPTTPPSWSRRIEHADDWQAPAARTGIEVFSDFAPALGAAFAEARQQDDCCSTASPSTR